MGKETVVVDTSIFIYAFDPSSKFHNKAFAVMRQIETQETQALIARVGIIEMLTGIKKENDVYTQQLFSSLIQKLHNVVIVDTNEFIADIASDLRAEYNIGTPDSIHIATGIFVGADRFITNDKKLKRVKDIPIQLLSEL